MKSLGVIPARFASTRFPGKPLAMIQGKPMIQRVYEQAQKTTFLSEIYVATDDERIEKAVLGFGGKVKMTSTAHQSGTDRCAEVLECMEKEGKLFDIVVNIQGDEPSINPGQIDIVIESFEDPSVDISTLAKKIESLEELFNSNVIKVIKNQLNNAIYFSRHPIPYQQNIDKAKWLEGFDYFKHIGIYAFRSGILKSITNLNRSSLEISESLEQLRWIENGYAIRIEETIFESIAVDTPEDLSKFSNIS
ncbi:MAG: 3-deoxy-manno-octulosonate cytidylyltransferase [Bacteroidales bacterium]